VTESKPSKSARKRQQLELQELGEQLIALNNDELSSLSLDERIETAIHNAGRIKSHGALRRQKQLIGKLMRDTDPAPIRAALALIRVDEAHDKRLFTKAERWRDRVIKDGATALDEFAVATGTDDAELRSWLAELDVAFSERAEKTTRRKIFRRIHEILVKLPQ
jgi:ribosome-associated protein